MTTSFDFCNFFWETVPEHSVDRETLQIFLPERRNIVALVRRLPMKTLDFFAMHKPSTRCDKFLTKGVDNSGGGGL
jgi:hypothetical protein